MKKIVTTLNLTKKIVIVTSALLILTLVFSACGVLNLDMGDYGDQNGGFDADADQGSDVTPAPELDGSREEVTINKNQGNNAEDGEKLTSAGQAYNTVSEVYYAVSNSVVEITTEIVENGSWMGQYVSEGAGSGVIIDANGLVVTNHHVIDGASNIVVRLATGEEYQATVMGSDAAADLAVLKINASGLTVAPMGCSKDLVVGEDIIVLGNPLGSLGGTLTTGIISATERNITVDGNEMVLLQTNAAINPGNSGGGLFNMAGELVGIVNAKMAGSDIEGLGFAIPIDYAHGIIEDLINYGYVKGFADHGLILLDVTNQNLPAAYYQYGITKTGVVILESKYTDELKYGDTVVSVNGEKITSSSRIDSIVRARSVGDEITVTVSRNNETITVTYKLGERGVSQSDLD